MLLLSPAPLTATTSADTAADTQTRNQMKEDQSMAGRHGKAAAVAGMSVFGHATAVHERIEPLTSAVYTDAYLKQTL